MYFRTKTVTVDALKSHTIESMCLNEISTKVPQRSWIEIQCAPLYHHCIWVQKNKYPLVSILSRLTIVLISTNQSTNRKPYHKKNKIIIWKIQAMFLRFCI